MSDIVGKPGQQTDVATADAVRSLDGALAFYYGVVGRFASGFGSFVEASGILSDELQVYTNYSSYKDADQRILPEGSISTYGWTFSLLQETRIGAQQGRGVLREYAAGVRPDALIGHLYAVEAMADIFLADLYCSGIPLSTVDYKGDFTMRSGSSTHDVYTTAVALFDSALALTPDSIRLHQLAQLGKARALLALGVLDSAADVARAVDDSAAYAFKYVSRAVSGSSVSVGGVFIRNGTTGAYFSGFLTVADKEGVNGLPYATGGDPRSDTASGVTRPSQATIPVYVAKKLSDPNGNNTIILANGTEARLIEAEAALARGETTTWLTILNRLRTTCTSTASCPTPAPAGTGGVSGLPLLNDPGSDTARTSLLFRERAYWLFLTGHRQGDLRRLIRAYGRPQEDVYPTGVYQGVFGQNYGSDVTIPVPDEERQRNPKYTGCIDREA